MSGEPAASAQVVGTVAVLRRYPVKSMLGESRDELTVTTSGVAGDRAWAAIDSATGKVASAKRANLWRHLLACEAHGEGSAVHIKLPGGASHLAGDGTLDDLLSALTGRAITLGRVPPAGAEVERSHPEAVLAEGLDAAVAYDPLQLGGGAPPGTFFDYAPIHLVTTATLDGLTAGAPDTAPMEEVRYRANMVIASPADAPAFAENQWLGGVVHIGAAVALRVILQTPRCAIPTLAHGALPVRPDALLAAVARNRVMIEGFGNLPAAGSYTAVLRGGTVRVGDTVTFTPA